jgi:hypothetical protein
MKRLHTAIDAKRAQYAHLDVEQLQQQRLALYEQITQFQEMVRVHAHCYPLMCFAEGTQTRPVVRAECVDQRETVEASK